MHNETFTDSERKMLVERGFDLVSDDRAVLEYTRITKLITPNCFCCAEWNDDGEGGYWQCDDEFDTIEEAINFCVIRS